ncbi:hypothetical protein LT493_40485 [Streptomyces tricolor]|nr:hypothetical protein [Streptomyces tricolor]
MTHKFTLAGLRIGGAKGGIVSDGSNREETFRTSGRTVKPAAARRHPPRHRHGRHPLPTGPSSSTRRATTRATGWAPRTCRSTAHLLRSRSSTSPGTASASPPSPPWRRAAVRTARSWCRASAGVGRAVTRVPRGPRPHPRGRRGRCSAISADRLPVADLVAVTDEFGLIDRSRLPQHVTLSDGPDAWLDVDADLLILAAQKHALNAENAHRLRAGLVVVGRQPRLGRAGAGKHRHAGCHPGAGRHRQHRRRRRGGPGRHPGRPLRAGRRGCQDLGLRLDRRPGARQHPGAAGDRRRTRRRPAARAALGTTWRTPMTTMVPPHIHTGAGHGPRGRVRVARLVAGTGRSSTTCGGGGPDTAAQAGRRRAPPGRGAYRHPRLRGTLPPHLDRCRRSAASNSTSGGGRRRGQLQPVGRWSR